MSHYRPTPREYEERHGETPEYLRESQSRDEPMRECDGCRHLWSSDDLDEMENGDRLCPNCIAGLDDLTEELKEEQEEEPTPMLGECPPITGIDLRDVTNLK